MYLWWGWSYYCCWKINSDEDSCMDCAEIETCEIKYYSGKYSTDNKTFYPKVVKSGNFRILWK